MFMSEQNILYVGNKPLQNYLLAALMQLGKEKEIIIKARGKAISKAVDVAVILTTRYYPGTAEITKVELNSETLPFTYTKPDGTQETRNRNVSVITIVVSKK